MNEIYLTYNSILSKLISCQDVPLILRDPLKSDFSAESLRKIEKESYDKVKVFFDEFEKINSGCKYDHFLSVTSEISEWIRKFLCSQDGGKNASETLKIVCYLINLSPDFYVDNLIFNQEIIKECLIEGLISKTNYDNLIELLDADGLMITKWKFLDIVHVKSIDCYNKFLYFSSKYNSIFIELFCDNLKELLDSCLSDEEKRNVIRNYANGIINDNVTEEHRGDIKTGTVESSSTDTIPYRRTESLFRTNNSAECFHGSDFVNNDTEDEDDDDADNLDINYDDLFGEFKNQAVKDILHFSPQSLNHDVNENLSVREYQKELAEKGIQGQNVLICAPTGSGKTIVAIKIVEDHFNNKSDGKVIFVVPTNALVEQQHFQFKKYLKNLKILKQSGQNKPGNVSFAYQIQIFDLFIVTCDILKNALETDEHSLSSIGVFSLIIFDECHHCDKGHSYNKVMNYYFKNKELNITVPQIIGMTASTGTDKAKNVSDALNMLFTLCANLDCKIVSTVKVNVSELQSNQNIPSQDILTPGSRDFDYFENDLLKIMNITEEKVRTLSVETSRQIRFPTDKWHDKYMNFISSLSKSSVNETSENGREIRCLVDYLEVFYRALLLNNLFTSERALALIKNFENESSTNYGQFIQQQLKKFFFDVNLEQDCNPSLDILKIEIVDQLDKNINSRIMIFVKEVRYANCMEKELQSANLKNVRCASFVGTNKSSAQGGLTSSAHSDILAQFRRGDINVLCCTSVAEEGLDVETCNLVIRYGYVTNETSMIQTRGRARAGDSRYILIVPSQMEWQINKENINRHRETMMHKAINEFQIMDKNVISDKINSFQLKRELQHLDLNDSHPITNYDSRNWTICCRMCDKVLCSSTDMRLVNQNSYVVINKDKHCNMLIEEVKTNSSQLKCTCNARIGYIQKYRDIFLPTLSVNKIIFQCGHDRKEISKWSNAPFRLNSATPAELNTANYDIYDI